VRPQDGRPATGLTLDSEVLLPVLERIRSSTITVKNDDYGRTWYHDNGRPCLFATYLLHVLVGQDFPALGGRPVPHARDCADRKHGPHDHFRVADGVGVIHKTPF